MLLLKGPWTCRWEESPVAYAVAGRNAWESMIRTVGDGNETFLVWRGVGMRASVALSGVCFWSWFTISLWEDINNRIKCTLQLSSKLKCSSPSHCQKFKLRLRFKPKPRLQPSRFLPIWQASQHPSPAATGSGEFKLLHGIASQPPTWQLRKSWAKIALQ